jgi:SAM-dependent methyltransferase
MQLSEAIDLIRADELTAPSTARWADLGCGAGLFSYALAHFLPTGSHIYAIDRVLSLKGGPTPNGVEVIPQRKDFVTDPLELQNMDGFLLANALHYVKNKPALIDKLKGSLNRNGRLLIVEYNTDRPVPIWVPYPVSFASLTSLFRSAGYGVVQKLGERPSRFGGTMYAALIQ